MQNLTQIHCEIIGRSHLDVIANSIWLQCKIIANSLRTTCEPTGTWYAIALLRYCGIIAKSLCSRCEVITHSSMWIHCEFIVSSLCTQCKLIASSLRTYFDFVVKSVRNQYDITATKVLRPHCELTTNSMPTDCIALVKSLRRQCELRNIYEFTLIALRSHGECIVNLLRTHCALNPYTRVRILKSLRTHCALNWYTRVRMRSPFPICRGGMGEAL